MTMTMTSTLGCQHPRPQSSDDGTRVSVCPYTRVPAACTGGCTAQVPVTSTGDRQDTLTNSHSLTR